MKRLCGCFDLKTVVIGENIVSIGVNAFFYCWHLETVTIGKKVTNIGDNAFSECKELKTINYAGTEEDWRNISIGSGNNYLQNATINYNYGRLLY